MKYLRTGLMLIIMAVGTGSCSSEVEIPEGLSDAGFYLQGDVALETIKNMGDGPHLNYLKGRIHEDQKNYKKALYHYSQSAFTVYRKTDLTLYAQPVYAFVTTSFKEKSELYDDALLRIAVIFRHYGENEYALKFLDKIKTDLPGLKFEVIKERSENLRHLSRHDEALEVLEKGRGDVPGYRAMALFSIRRAVIFLQQQKPALAEKELVPVMKEDPDSWQARLAADMMADYYDAKATVPQDLSAALLLAESLYHRREYDRGYRLIADKGEKASALKARLLVRMKRYREAEEAFSEAAALEKSGTGKAARYYYRELWRMGRKNDALKGYHAIIDDEKSPMRQEVLEALLSYYRTRSHGVWQGYAEKYIDAGYKEKLPEVLWKLGRNDIRHGNNDRALERLRRLTGEFPDTHTSAAGFFWIYKISSDENEKAQAVKMMVSHHPESSYTWYYLEREAPDSVDKDAFAKYMEDEDVEGALQIHALLSLKDYGSKEFKERRESLLRFRPEYRDVEKWHKGSRNERIAQDLERYFITGDAAAISREMQFISESGDEKKLTEARRSVMALASEYHYPYRAVIELFSLMRDAGVRENVFLMDEKTIDVLYPQPFASCVSRESKKNNVSPETIYSVVRAESMFNHGAVSGAGAVGLMQLMPATARGIAREMNKRHYNLKDPCTSIAFGAHYLAWLDKFCKGDIYSIVAGYNAGVGNVRKWKERMGDKPSYWFIEFTPFEETRYYMLRTGKFLGIYSLLINGALPD